MSDITVIKRMLNDRAKQVAEMLLPGGRKEAQEWRAGSIGGEKGKSLGVHLSGPKVGIWSDFATGEGGDLIGLWMACKGMTLPQALDAIRSWLGVERQEPYRKPDRSYERPLKPRCSVPAGKVLDYLTKDRCIPTDVLDLYKVGATETDIVFPFLLPDGVLALAKTRKAADGAKPKPTAANCEPILFGWQAIPDNARELVIAEGEIDALSWAAYGLVAASVPFGGGKGGKQNWIESEFERLERFERIYLSTDMDKEGDAAASEIAGRLGRHRCYRVLLPLKDANECRQRGVPKDQMHAAIASAQTLDPEGLKRASDYADKVIHLFWPAEEERVGFTVPYRKLSDRLVFRPGELTLWSGAAGAGKSQILTDCIPHWVQQGGRVCLASLEMKGEQSLRRLCKQTGGLERPAGQYIKRILSWLDQGLLLYEKVGKEGVDSILGVFDYARSKYGCDIFIVDSLMRLGIASDDYVGQEKAIFGIIDWTVKHSIHTHMVAHARKGEKGQGAPETEDVKGAMEIGANAFNIVTVWRNRRHEDELSNSKLTDEEKAALNQKPGVILNVAKQRNGDFEGKIGLWFDQDTYRYASSWDSGDREDRLYIPRDDGRRELSPGMQEFIEQRLDF